MVDGIKPVDAALLGRLSEGPRALSPNKDPEKAAEQFEGLLLKEMFKSMWQNVPSTGMLSGSSEEQMYRDMLNEAVANSVSEGRGIGIKDVILKDIERLDKKS